MGVEEGGVGGGEGRATLRGARKQVGRDLRRSPPLRPPSPPAEVLVRKKY